MPQLVLNEKIAVRNIERMVEKAHTNQVVFRPHFKTHQSAEIGEWFQAVGVSKITVSSVDMAEYFAKHGWKDITIAIPTPLNEITRINALASQIKLDLLVDSNQTVQYLRRYLTVNVGVWIKIDVGYHRCGLLWYDTEAVIELAELINNDPKLGFKGLLTHAGHTYKQPDSASIRLVHDSSVQRLIDLQSDINMVGIDAPISIGDTPGCSLADSFRGISEIRPGNFIFHDLMQLNLGVCQWDDIAVVVRCPVIGKYPKRGEIVIHGGTVHFSKETLTGNNGKSIYGYMAGRANDGWGPPISSVPVITLSQEHGVIQVPENQMENINIGDSVLIYPVHSCLTANLYSNYITTDGSLIPKYQSMN